MLGVVPCLRHSHSAAVQNDQMIIISGGLSEDETVLSDIFCLHVSVSHIQLMYLFRDQL